MCPDKRSNYIAGHPDGRYRRQRAGNEGLIRRMLPCCNCNTGNGAAMLFQLSVELERTNRYYDAAPDFSIVVWLAFSLSIATLSSTKRKLAAFNCSLGCFYRCHVITVIESGMGKNLPRTISASCHQQAKKPSLPCTLHGCPCRTKGKGLFAKAQWLPLTQ